MYHDSQGREIEDLEAENEDKLRSGRVSIDYTWPNSDPPYWQMLVEYVAEAENEGDKPPTFGDWIEDFVLWMRNQS